MTKQKQTKAEQTKAQIKEAAENDLEFFINLVHPQRVLGMVHKDVINWWTRQDALSHQLTLLPRDHQKSALIAYRVAWEITRNPIIRVLYISATAGLAIKQLKFIKDILTSDRYRAYWPEMVNKEESKREKWTETEISVDHPSRAHEAVRDPTIFTAGLTTTIVGLHCDIAVFDDVVINDNAYTKEARNKLRTQASLLASIAGTDSRQWAVGTRYHPDDLYNDFLEMEYEVYNEDGEILKTQPLYEIFERQVESNGDGTGEFLWPRQQRHDGRWFGFDMSILAKKRAQYTDTTQFRAQYYNNPNDINDAPISPDSFQYYDRSSLDFRGGHWFIGDRRLNVFASIDFAFSLDKKADFTAIVVVGVDTLNNYYVLGIERFKTNKISDYYDRILYLHNKWHFRKIRAEINAGQVVIVKDLKENYIRRFGIALFIEEHRNTSATGTKEERMHAVLQPRYNNGQVYHYKGGNTQLLEDELVSARPPHDDIKDALASAIEICVAPSNTSSHGQHARRQQRNESISRFGGIT
jgi:hypothetical protein